jgi:SAM-dependent methyltransferase
MFFDDPQAAFANLLDWLRPGGQFAFAVWGPLAENPWMTSVREVLAKIVDIPPSDRKRRARSAMLRPASS